LITGDIFISIERVRENAAKFGITETDELHRVIIHGVLHLLGYKDKTPDSKQEMTQKEDFYLGKRDFNRLLR
jgi:rRNA maturation RNase YbeY